MENKDDLRDELQELSPMLAKFKEKEAGFKVPKNYFQNLPGEVLRRLEPESAPIAASRRNWLNDLAVFIQGLLQPRYAMAMASVAVLVVAGIIFFKPEKPATDVQFVATVSLEEISEEEINAYLSNNIEAVEETLLAEAEVAGEKSEPSTHGKKPKKKSLPQPETEEIEDYLDEYLDEIELEDLEDIL